MDNAFLDEGKKPVTNLFQEVNGLSFGEFRVFSEVLLQVAVTYLLDYVVIVAAFHDVEDPHDVF